MLRKDFRNVEHRVYLIEFIYTYILLFYFLHRFKKRSGEMLIIIKTLTELMLYTINLLKLNEFRPDFLHVLIKGFFN